MTKKRVAIVVDYQNVHITGAEMFLPGRPTHEGLLDPFKFACQLVKMRKEGDPEGNDMELKRVEVYRGLPLQEANQDAFDRNQEQKSNWERGHIGVVDVTLHPLMYDWEWIDGEKVPIADTAREKGVDVLCALSLIRLARSGQYDIVILASRDTDLAPALQEAARIGKAKIEAAKWYDPSDKRTFGNMRGTRGIWTNSMTCEHFMASLDLRDYS